MKLAEARAEVREINVKVDSYIDYLRSGKIELVSDYLTECNQLLDRKEALSSAIAEQEKNLVILDNELSSIEQKNQILSQKIKLLEALLFRSDLSIEQSTSLRQQLETFRFLWETLTIAIDSCLWETDVLVD